MNIAEQIIENLIDPEKHGPILRALMNILEEDGEKGLKEWITSRIQEIQNEEPDNQGSEA